MMYDIEISGLVSIDADSKDEAIKKVKELFDDGTISHEDLFFSCDAE